MPEEVVKKVAKGKISKRSSFTGSLSGEQLLEAESIKQRYASSLSSKELIKDILLVLFGWILSKYFSWPLLLIGSPVAIVVLSEFLHVPLLRWHVTTVKYKTQSEAEIAWDFLNETYNAYFEALVPAGFRRVLDTGFIGDDSEHNQILIASNNPAFNRIIREHLEMTGTHFSVINTQHSYIQSLLRVGNMKGWRPSQKMFNNGLYLYRNFSFTITWGGAAATKKVHNSLKTLLQGQFRKADVLINDKKSLILNIERGKLSEYIGVILSSPSVVDIIVELRETGGIEPTSSGTYDSELMRVVNTVVNRAEANMEKGTYELKSLRVVAYLSKYEQHEFMKVERQK
jgi:hypothetical protein